MKQTCSSSLLVIALALSVASCGGDNGGSGDKAFYQRKGNEATSWITTDCNLRLGDLQVHVFHTPGHSPGSVCFQVDKHLFSGDTLFKESIGRTPDDEAMVRLVEHVSKKLFALPRDTLVYPGHGGLTTIGVEKDTNPFFMDGQGSEGDAVNRAP